MTKPKTAPAEAPSEQRKRPPHGGRFVRDPKTGELECIERTDTTGESTQDDPVAEPGSGTADMSGDDAASGPGSTSGDAANQEG